VRGRVAVSAGERSPGRPLMVFDIFTDSSCSCGERNAKGCVCTGILHGEGCCYDGKTNGNVEDARLKSKGRRPLQSQKKRQNQNRNCSG